MADMLGMVTGTATIEELKALQSQLHQLEVKHQQIPSLPAPSKPKLKPPKPNKPTGPSFQIIGRELRGGERFLSITPVDSQSLDQSRIMRIGETYAGWQLQDFDTHTAVFVIDGVTRQLNY